MRITLLLILLVLKTNYCIGQIDQEKYIDSIIHIVYPTDDNPRNVQREYFEYDSQGRIISDLNYSWDSYLIRLYKDFRCEYSYNEQDSIIQFNKFRWDTLNNVWYCVAKSIFDYDSLGNKIYEESYLYDYEKAVLSGFRKYEALFNTNSLLTYKLFYDWDTLFKNWNNCIKSIYEYDSEKTVCVTTCEWINSSWCFKFKIQKEYNLYSQLKLNILYHYSDSSWEYYSKDSLIYNSVNEKIEQVCQYWHPTNYYWLNSYKIDYIYDPEHNLIQETKFIEINDNWVGQSKYIYSYDYNKNELLNSYYKWDQEINDWKLIDELKNDFQYNIDNKIIENIKTNTYYLITKDEGFYMSSKNKVTYDYDSLGRINSKHIFNYEINDWEQFQKFIYLYNEKEGFDLITQYNWDNAIDNWVIFTEFYSYYKKPTQNIINLNTQLLYPNPVESNLIINYSGNGYLVIKIYNLQGQLLRQQSIDKTNNIISMSGFPSGNYLFQIFNHNSMTSEIIIKQ